MHRVCFILLFLCSLAAPSSQAKDTSLKLYRPFSASEGQASISVLASKAGYCPEQSKLILREDAWRCHAGGKVYDPCFVKPFGNRKEALCPQSPWDGDSIQITVKEPLDNIFHSRLDMSRAYPWAVLLSDGVYCQAVDRREHHDNLPVRYQCQDKSLLIGHLQRCDPRWQILQKKNQQIQSISLETAWF